MFNKHILGMIGIGVLFFLALFAATYQSFFVYVSPNEMLIIVNKTGRDLPSGQIIATEPGEKGPRLEVLGEGRHFVMPYLYETRIEPVVYIPPGKIGVVRSSVGDPPTEADAILVSDNQRGVWRRVLTPGKYRMNPDAYKIEIHDAVEIRPGYVGFVTSLVGRPPTGDFAGPEERGIQQKVLQPGLYYLNPFAFRVQEVEVGINQVSFLDENQIRFPSRDAFNISLEATVEWELLPHNVARVLAEFGAKEAIEEKVIIPQSRSIGRLQGSSYVAKDFLLGHQRERFQQTFTRELERVCREKNLTIHSAFIRNLVIPDELLKPIRESVIAVERKQTAQVWEITRVSHSELEREKELINQKRAEVRAETKAAVQTIHAEAEAEVGKIEADTKLEVSKMELEIANLEAEKTVLLGEANASVVRLGGEAMSQAQQMKITAFGNNSRAYANYMFANRLPTNMNLRLVYSGPGTMWTDLSGTAGVSEISGMKYLQDSSVQQSDLRPAQTHPGQVVPQTHQDR